MSKQILEFMKTWADKNIRPFSYALIPEASKMLRLAFLADAERCGVPIGQVEAVAGCSIERFILRSLKKAQDTVVQARYLEEGKIEAKQVARARRAETRAPRRPAKNLPTTTK
jgi:hypothetical protein